MKVYVLKGTNFWKHLSHQASEGQFIFMKHERLQLYLVNYEA